MFPIQRAEEAEAAACRMREAFTAILRITIDLLSDNPGPKDSFSLFDITKLSNAALSATAPCPHAAEVGRLRKLCGEAAGEIEILANYRRGYSREKLAERNYDLATRLRAAKKGGGE